MKFDPHKHHRRSIRLKDYDYSQSGAYFITICTRGRECFLGEVMDGEMRLSDLGEIVRSCWEDLPKHYPHIEPDAFVVMPNHVHGIVSIVGAGLKPAPTGQTNYGLPEIIRAFKTFSSRRINEFRNSPGTPIWQRNYYEHVIRNEASLNSIRQYIASNPVMWETDEENPTNIGRGAIHCAPIAPKR